ncbi:MAG: hypothetical protein IT395_01810 [Candidatus Omnitrophica bacterium]|nr:hypothetical protein [Candidatus Omnitrophota bacterium]
MRPFKANALNLSHLPTWMLIIGLPLYWLEMAFHQNNHGITTPLAWIAFAVVAAVAVRHALVGCSWSWKTFWPGGWIDRSLLISGALLCLGMTAIYCYAALLPPHLPQEEDVLNYHYTFPRQHLIRQSFQYVRWSTCDLFPYPVQFGLAPFWFVTELPNKLPQSLFFLSVPAILVRLLKFLGQSDPWKCTLLVFAFFGAHHVVIQGGSAMLDIVLAYLFLAALDSFLRGNWIMAAVEFVFYFWSKSFAPLQMLAVMAVLSAALFVLKRSGFQLNWGFPSSAVNLPRVDLKFLRKFLLLFGVLSIIVAGPFVVKSLKIGGTPLFPFFVGVFPHFQHVDELPWDWDSFVAAAKYDLSMKDAYGLPRTGINLIKHFWLIAVPQEGVNNVFDYPVGLVYLLCLGPFLYLMVKGLRQKQIGILPLLICVIWSSWWSGSQQSRFLYVPLFLLYLTVIAELRYSKLFVLSVLFAVLISAGSAFRAHCSDFGKPPESLLSRRDQEFRRLSREYMAQKRSDKVVVKDYQAAYAQFPATVLAENIPYTLQIESFR